MASRLKLQEYLETLCDNVYFQPPASIHMNYPAIRYERYDINNIFADDIQYHQEKLYSVTIIDRDPDSPIVENISKLPMCSMSRHYTSEGLNHDVFMLYW